MKEFYDNQIKPLNDELGRSLRIRHIPVRHDSRERTVPVLLKEKGMTNIKYAQYRAMGLMV